MSEKFKKWVIPNSTLNKPGNNYANFKAHKPEKNYPARMISTGCEAFTKNLASRRALCAGLDPSEEIRRWYAVIACAIQRTNAKILRGEPVPAAVAPPVWRRLDGGFGRDLGVARG